MKTTTNSTAAPASTETYASAYARLTAIADKLKGAGATDVDTLVQDLRAARAAYATCKGRLDAIRREVDAEVEAAGEVARRRTPPSSNCRGGRSRSSAAASGRASGSSPVRPRQP